ncbi:DNA-binding protein [Tetragenococcus osmophilus]|uniref:DNA-binding protein n=1 Tax=Tetragenococcus osmophilus TaxID=526944 RepID=A0AA37XKM8_9ENTE|nr:S1-like domain-containing RNA-binding protein [Tetragenococcus osmophilus]AYW48314.1 DNA-binding protein [Tetragenococcus osmophilus]GMA54123.1 S1 RNA-binding protein [Alicyclobacillus contaminans]GMA71991.1 S1 RNA-binding protein [Tetragenococcus osmophilus]
MNELIASVFTGVITDENEQYYFVQKSGQTFRLKKEEGDFTLGEAVEGFGYLNQKQEAAFTTNIPKIRKGHYAFAPVTEVRRDLGVFVDIGLPDKDIAVSLDELPTLHNLWPKKEDRLMIALRVDKKGRIWGTLAEDKHFQSLKKVASEDMQNKDISGNVYRLKLAGSYLLTEDYHIGFIHPSERYAEPRLGQYVSGRVIGVRPDGILNVSLKPRAYEAIPEDAAMIYAYLKQRPNQEMAYTIKSSPEEIEQLFGISKARFKRALGNLLKQRLIVQENGVTKLTENSN